MKRYEYKVLAALPETTVISTNKKRFEKMAQEFEVQLNELGAEGWELVSRMDGLFFFKREIG